MWRLSASAKCVRQSTYVVAQTTGKERSCRSLLAYIAMANSTIMIHRLCFTDDGLALCQISSLRPFAGALVYLPIEPIHSLHPPDDLRLEQHDNNNISPFTIYSPSIHPRRRKISLPRTLPIHNNHNQGWWRHHF